MSMFKWELVDPAPGQPVAPHQRLSWGNTSGLGAPACHRDVRGDVRVPDHHGAQPEPRDHDERNRDDLLPVDREGRRAELPRHVGLVRRWREGHLRPERRTGRRDRRDPDLRGRARARRRGDPLLGAEAVNRVLLPVVTGAVVMLIGFNLARSGHRHLSPRPIRGSGC